LYGKLTIVGKIILYNTSYSLLKGFRGLGFDIRFDGEKPEFFAI
jgi:hypothetical protein